MQKLLINHITKYGLVLVGILIPSICFTQNLNPSNDMEFIQQNTDTQSTFKEREYIFDDSKKSVFVKYNPLAITLGGALYIYQNSISYQFSATCLCHPSCSEYSKQAIAEFGIFKGVFLSADRITRCNKVAAIDIHPLTINEKTKKANNHIKLYKIKNTQ